MTVDRRLRWDGCYNVRDLGGLRTSDGRSIRWGAVVRSDSVHRLTAAGWDALHAHGVRTILDLRNDDEVGADAAPRPPGLTTVHVPLDDAADAEFWDYCWANDLDGSPLYYGPFLERKPDRCAAVIAAIARAQPGGVVVHCGVGRDRTGLITLLLLALAGVSPDEIAADYELSTDCLTPLYATLGVDDQGPRIREILVRKATSARDCIRATLSTLDIDAYLRSAGLRDDDLAAVRARLLDPDAARDQKA
jgi:protein-tyrosine phosphatase